MCCVAIASICQIGETPPTSLPIGLVTQVCCGVGYGLGSLISLCICMALPPIWNSIAILMLFLLALCVMDAPSNLYDGLTPVGYSIRPRKRRRRKRRRRRYDRLRWKKLPFGMGIRARRRNSENGIKGGRPYCIIRPWRHKRNVKAKARWKRKKSTSALLRFLTPSKPKSELPEFLTRNGIVLDSDLTAFCSEKGDAFLKLPRLMKRLNSNDHAVKLEKLMKRLQLCRLALEMDHQRPNKKATFKDCMLVWDTGASFGLSPFRADFIDYVECHIPVKDISKTNYVVGIGTTLHKFMVDGEAFWLPCLSYHLPTADVRLFSPQTFHTLYGGSSTVEGDRVNMRVAKPVNMGVLDGNSGSDNFWEIPIPIDREGANVPIVYNSAVSAHEMREIGPQIRSALNHVERKTDFFGSYSAMHYDGWGMSTVEDEFDHYAGFCGPCVASDDNISLSNAQKELLLWHWKLGVSMDRIQELMKPHPMEDPAGVTTTAEQVIKPRLETAATCEHPICQSCQLSRARMRNPKVTKSKAITDREGAISKEQVHVGDFVSMDQYVVTTPGRLPTGYGREAEANRFHGGTIFRDAASKVIHVENQVSLGAGETVQAKKRFEEWLYEQAHEKVKHYHSDNGVFTAEFFTDQCKQDGQTQSFSGVGAKHQNAEAERAIQTIMYMARSFMIHSALHWTDHGADDLSLWSFAVDHAAWLYNRIPQRRSGIAPLEFITKTRDFFHRDLLRAHVWGCPTYVLEAKLQDGKKLPKWNRRARMGQFLGFSRQHSSLVAMVRNLHTGHVSPQYHCVFDDRFDTIFTTTKTDEEVDDICDQLFVTNRDCYVEEEYDADDLLVYKPPPLDEVWLSTPERIERKEQLNKQRIRNEARERRIRDEVQTKTGKSSDLPDLVAPDSDDDSSDDESMSDDPLPRRDSVSEGDDGPIGWQDHPRLADEPESLSNPVDIIPAEDIADDIEGPVVEPAPNIAPEGASEGAPRLNEPRRRSRRTRIQDTSPEPQTTKNSRSAGGRLRKQPRKRYNIMSKKQVPVGVRKAISNRKKCKKGKYRHRMNHLRTEGDKLMNKTTLDDTAGVTVEDIMSCPLSKFIHFAANDCGYGGSRLELVVNWVHPLFLKARSAASKEDNPNWREAMVNGEFKEEFWQAAVDEIETLVGMDAWEVVDRPENANVIASIWAFKIKRFPDGLIKKFKARFCARGDQQLEGIDFFETYAPVVQWTTVRLLLILEVLLKLTSKQGDVTAAFLHGTLDEKEKVYVEMPTGFRQNGKVLKLKKSLYGLRQSPRMFWQYLTDAMKSCGMEVSKMDPCLFVGKHVMCICYVDDILFWSKDEKHINDLAIKLRKEGLLLEQEDDAAGFLGVRLTKTPEGLIEMKQTGLIDRVIENLGLDTKLSKNKWTPAEHKPLVRDEDGEPPDGDFSYSSVVGMLLYLSGHTRPDIAYAVNCCARYMFCPKKSHENALKRIGRYLKATRDQGLILNPSDKLSIDSYPDADFAGMYGHEEITDPSCVKSRTGFVINVANCPVLWISKLQQETALSTMEAEIIALAHSCRELFPIIDIVHELGVVVGLPTTDLTSMHVSIHEDNAGALVLAETIPPQYTPRSKYYAIKTVWFREEIQKRKIKLFKIDTVEQLGDMFTKGLPKVTFEYLRKKIMG